MSSRAKITFFPKVNTSDYNMKNIDIIDYYNDWNYEINNYIEDGYIYTDTKNNIDIINNNYWIKFKPKIGYEFISIHKTNSNGTVNNGEFKIENDGSCIVYPWQNGTAPLINNYLYFEISETIETKYMVNYNLKNCTTNNYNYYNKNENIDMILNCDDNCIFNEIPFIIMSNDKIYFKLSSDKKIATLNFTILDNITVNAISIYTPYKITTKLSNCICNYNDYIPDGNIKIILTCNDGYEFKGYINYKIGSISHSTNNYTNDNTICTIDINVDNNIEIIAIANKKQEQISTFTNLYKVNNNILTKLSKVRFYNISGSSTELVDYGSFIINLISIPFKIPDEMIADLADIQLGNYDTNIKAELLQNYILNVNIGNITIPEKYKNVYDYKDVKCILHLPYTENIILENEYIINHTINIKYIIDLYSGNCTININSDFTNNIIFSKNFNIAKHLPFIQKQNNTIVSTNQNIIYNNIKNAYIEVIRNIPYNVNSVFGNETIDFGTLENYIGYIKVSDILLNISANNEEKNEIETLLKNGVFINTI